MTAVFAVSFFTWAVAGPALGDRAGEQRWDPSLPPPALVEGLWAAFLPVLQACLALAWGSV